MGLNKGGVLGAALSLAVTTMGAGILTLPSAYANAGIIPATLLLGFVAYLTVLSVDFIVLAIEKLGLNSYEEITERLCGKVALEFVRWMLIIYNVGSAIGYLVVLGDIFEPLQYFTFNSEYFYFLKTGKHILLVFWLVFIVPLTCLPTLNSLHTTSFLAISSTIFISFLIVLRYFVPNEVEKDTIAIGANKGAASGSSAGSGKLQWWDGLHPLLALPIIMFSFDCQSLVFQVYAGLNVMTRRTMLYVSVISIIVSGAIHAAVGFFGYISNPTDIRENIISNYDPKTDMLFLIGYIFYAIPICLAYVILLFPIRDSLFILWYGYSSASIATHVPRREDFIKITAQEEKLEHEIDQYYKEHPERAHEHFDNSSFFGAFRRSRLTTKNNSFVHPPGKMMSENNSMFAAPPSNYGTGGHGSFDTSPPNCCLATKIPSEEGDGYERVQMPAVMQLQRQEGDDFAEEDAQDESAMIEEEREQYLETLHEKKKEKNPYETISFRDHLIVTLALNVLCLAGALLLPGIVSVVAFLGGMCSSSLCFTFPAIYRYQLHAQGLAKLNVFACFSKNKGNDNEKESLLKNGGRNQVESETNGGDEHNGDNFEYIMMWTMLAFGIIGGLLGTGIAAKVYMFPSE